MKKFSSCKKNYEKLRMMVATDLDLLSTSIRAGLVTNPINIEFYEKAQKLYNIGNHNDNPKFLEKLHNKCSAIFNAILDNPNKANSFSDLVLLFVKQAQGLIPISGKDGEFVAKKEDEESLIPCFKRILVTKRAEKASPKSRTISFGRQGRLG